ncbi:branched-chain amino acid transport system / permease component family protein [Paraburkholderia xenovorans LB400]|uniref:Amino acid/amide ABC transporter ATP-binding protein 1, HAAT family / amino acid/amide ABC transporter membrane protein 2, HAAT family n=1 Tax=Paraburkholderia xenovorans (strain LB400) TaxID=266265 RepID=Q13GB9_PARXL|nr:branched-chain amino acid ABC transporter ATP-binding protein/permease [Paraburkholderia xenovorans]ABE36870.1 amino acid/amide ABC transporter ATP-binding protein 1, HAAT family / amino acid/amide ABC transporter membrane protein 2, HAAT family [Paraburkholderia xenovorans LB400]AIP34623.1 branched-chain amino acid transport system / permease component family protein [Paraburkholderia xenovorans LB400]
MKRKWLVAVGCLALVVAPLVLPDFYTTLLIYTGLASIVVLGLVVLTGVGGMTSFGQATFVGLSAYTTGAISTTLGWSPWVTLPIAVLLTCLAAAVIGLLTVRLSGHYLVLGTVAWSVGLYYLFGNLPFLGGYNGISDIPPITFFGFSLAGSRPSYYLIWAVVAVAVVCTMNLLDSRTGRAIRSLRNPVLAESFGIDIYRLRLPVFIYAAFLAAISGWLYAHYFRFVNPAPFGFDGSIDYAFMLVLGGATQVFGAIVGAFVLVVGKMLLQIGLTHVLPGPVHWDQIFFGLLIIGLFHHARSGILSARRMGAASPDNHEADTEDTVWIPAEIPCRFSSSQANALAAQPSATLRVEKVSRRFGSLLAVNGVSFDAAPGQVVGVIGPNGAGKSTLFNLIAGTLSVDQGEVWLGEHCLSRLSPHQVIRHRVARTFQHVQLRPGQSVLSNVALGAHWLGRKGFIASLLRLDRHEERMLKARAMAAIERAGLKDVAFADAHTLPLGRQRVVEIARALSASPSVLLLDEPAAGLRHQEKRALGALIQQLREEGLTVLIVEHDMEFLMDLVDKIVVVNFGTKLCEGMPQTVQSDPQVIETYLGAE